LALRNASPVPHLTSLYHFHRAGDPNVASGIHFVNCIGCLISSVSVPEEIDIQVRIEPMP
jgi:hypothetical protein